MRKLVLGGLAIVASAALTTIVRPSQAGIIAPLGLREAADQLRVTETVQFSWRGKRYCWYNAGWRGPGWYQCGFRTRRGRGWGGPAGWHGWRRPGAGRPGIRPPGPSRPGMQRPRPLPEPLPGRGR
jgi:hypothetical protein